MKGNRFVIRALSLAMILAGTSVAASAAEQEAPEKPKSEKQVCKYETATGSFMSRRICHTKAEWEAIAKQSQDDLDRTRAMERSRSLVNGNR